MKNGRELLAGVHKALEEIERNGIPLDWKYDEAWWFPGLSGPVHLGPKNDQRDVAIWLLILTGNDFFIKNFYDVYEYANKSKGMLDEALKTKSVDKVYADKIFENMGIKQRRARNIIREIKGCSESMEECAEYWGESLDVSREASVTARECLDILAKNRDYTEALNLARQALEAEVMMRQEAKDWRDNLVVWRRVVEDLDSLAKMSKAEKREAPLPSPSSCS